MMLAVQDASHIQKNCPGKYPVPSFQNFNKNALHLIYSTRVLCAQSGQNIVANNQYLYLLVWKIQYQANNASTMCDSSRIFGMKSTVHPSTSSISLTILFF
jgi:hypothetical protein